MRIEYELTENDWGAFGEHCARTAPGFRKSAQMGAIGGMLAILGVAVFVGRLGSATWIAVGLAVAMAWGFFWPRHVVRHAGKHMRSRNDLCLRGRHLLEALPEGLHGKCDVTDSTVQWRAVHGVAETGEHVFVMLSPTEGYIVPKKRVRSGDVAAFAREVERLRTA